MNNNSQYVDVVERLKKFVLAHPEMSKSGFIQGLEPETGKIVIIVNGEKKKITIDELESGHLNQNSAQPQNVQMPAQEVVEKLDQQPEEIEVMEDVPSTPEIPSVMIDTPVMEAPANNNGEIKNLKEFQEAVLSKNEVAVNKSLETFAVDETGSINMNKAIKIVTDNCTNNVINSIRDNTMLSNDLSKYDVTSKPIEPMQPAVSPEDISSLIDKSFNNILVYVEAARLKNIVYNEMQIAAAKKKYATGIQDKINVLGLNSVKPTPLEPSKQQQQDISLNLKPDTDIKKAGFADILILTLIVITYAAIIINLITKLK